GRPCTGSVGTTRSIRWCPWYWTGGRSARSRCGTCCREGKPRRALDPPPHGTEDGPRMATVTAPHVEQHASPCRPVHCFTVEQYERMTELGLLTASDRVELLEGIIVDKMTQNPPHNAAIDFVRDQLAPLLPPEYRTREQKAVRLGSSEPEPDVVV